MKHGKGLKAKQQSYPAPRKAGSAKKAPQHNPPRGPTTRRTRTKK